MHGYSPTHSLLQLPLLSFHGVSGRLWSPENPSVCLSTGSERAMEVRPPAPQSFLCKPLSPFRRVFAAGAVAADSEALVENQKLSSYVPKPDYSESGWDRLRDLFVKE